MKPQSTWFQSEDDLLDELRRAGRTWASTPVIPGYDDLRELGRGGQGVVFSALQRSTKRQVAIKVILDGALASASALRRFEREVELAATLRHPGIVALHDSGATHDGRQYLVMELAQGAPLDRAFATGERPTVEDACQIIAQACDAVQHAHQRGVIHRDLKPSNVFVAREQSPGQSSGWTVKVLDFGLAKATSADTKQLDASAPALSLTGQFMGSLAWASPEQAMGQSDAIDSRSDVYALGVMLYHLLTARFPYDVSGGLKQTLDHIANTPPLLPRTIVPSLSDDLQTIVLRALAKDPSRRYQSAGDLAADLRSFLAGEPIAARRDSAWYGVSRTLRRYRVASAVGALALLATTGALVVSVLALREANAQREQAQRQTILAEGQAQRSRAITRFVSDMLTAADPGRQNKDIRVVDVLAFASSSLDATLGGEPLARASVRSLLSTAYRNLRLPELSLSEADAGLAIAASENIGSGEELVALKTAKAATLMDLELRTEGLALAGEASELARTLFGLDDARSIEADATLASLLDQSGQLAEAEDLKRDVLLRSERAFGRDSREALGAAGNLGYTLNQAGRLDDTIALLEDVVARSTLHVGPNDITTLAPMTTLTSAYNSKGLIEKSNDLQKDLLGRFERGFGVDNLTTVQLSANYANSLYSLGRYEEGLPIALRAHERMSAAFGPDHPTTLRVGTQLTSIYKGLGRHSDALPIEEAAVASAVRAVGPHDRLAIYLRNNVATTYRTLGRLEDAERSLRQAMADGASTFPATHSMPETLQYNLAATLRLRQPPTAESVAETISLLESASAGFLEKLGPTSDWTIDAITELADALDASGRGAEAATWRAKLPASR